MAHDDHRHRLPRQVALEPFGRGDVEVVRRLVQEHHVGALQQQLGEHHPRLLAAGERATPSRWNSDSAKPRPDQDLLDPMVDRIGVLVLDLLVQRVVAARGPLAVGVVLGLGHLLRGLLQLVLKVDQRGHARLDDVDQRLVRREVGLLPQQADPDPRPNVANRRNRAGRCRPGSASAWSCRRRWARPARSARRRGPRTPGPGRPDRR